MEHPITPPPELVQQWASESLATQHLCTQAARWGADQQLKLDAEQIAQAYQAGADQELEACCKWLAWESPTTAEWVNRLRAARRPKPLSKADQAIADLGALVADLSKHGMGFKATNLRRALERLKELEAAE